MIKNFIGFVSLVVLAFVACMMARAYAGPEHQKPRALLFALQRIIVARSDIADSPVDAA